MEVSKGPHFRVELGPVGFLTTVLTTATIWSVPNKFASGRAQGVERVAATKQALKPNPSRHQGFRFWSSGARAETDLRPPEPSSPHSPNTLVAEPKLVVSTSKGSPIYHPKTLQPSFWEPHTQSPLLVETPRYASVLSHK